jgi:hypothetical protein
MHHQSEGKLYMQNTSPSVSFPRRFVLIKLDRGVRRLVVVVVICFFSLSFESSVLHFAVIWLLRLSLLIPAITFAISAKCIVT